MSYKSKLKHVDTKDVPWITEAAKRLSDWLIDIDQRLDKGRTWNVESLRSPGMYDWTVRFVTYEDLFTDSWAQPWFQNGIKAFTLLSLEHERHISLLQSRTGDLFVSCSNDEVYTVDDFLNGESLPHRHDPEFSDLFCDPVSTLGHVVGEFYPDAEFDNDRQKWCDRRTGKWWDAERQAWVD